MPECPVNAICEESEVPRQWQDFIPLDALWFDHKAAARSKIDDLLEAGVVFVVPSNRHAEITDHEVALAPGWRQPNALS